MEPMLVKEILSSKGKSLKKLEPKRLEEMMSKQTARTMKDLMKGVVAEGTGTNAAISGITVCGKTGTADHNDNPIKKRAPHSWFIGFALYENPQIAIAVIVEEGGVGGGIAAKITRELMKTYLK